MVDSARVGFAIRVAAAAGILLCVAESSATAQYGDPFGLSGNPYGQGSPFGTGSGSMPQAGGVRRMTNVLANPLNFKQHGQMTGVGPIRGTVRVYNQFGLYGISAATGMGGGQLPGQGATPGDDPPQGVLLHVNYASMYLPQRQYPRLPSPGLTDPFGQFGGMGGFPGTFGGGGMPGGFGLMQAIP